MYIYRSILKPKQGGFGETSYVSGRCFSMSILWQWSELSRALSNTRVSGPGVQRVAFDSRQIVSGDLSLRWPVIQGSALIPVIAQI